MILVDLLLAAFWVALAVATRADADFARVRRRYAWGLFASAAICLLGWLMARFGLREFSLAVVSKGEGAGAASILEGAPFVMSMMGVVAIALADRMSHSVGTLRRILLLLANALVFFSVRNPVVLAISWTIAPCIIWFELRTRSRLRPVNRLFVLHHGLSVVAFAVAAAMPSVIGGAWTVVAIMAAIGIREAVIPGHGWLVRFVEQAPMGLVVAFVAPQLGVHAHIQLLDASVYPELSGVIALFGSLTAVLAAALGTVQSKPRRALAYLLMSQTALVAIGIGRASDVAHAGGLLTWHVLVLAMSGFAMTVSALESRRGGLSLGAFSGCFAGTPRMAAGFLTMGLSTVGFPLTMGFVAEDLLVQGSVIDRPVLAFVLIVATALNAVNVVRFFFHAFSGRRDHAGDLDLGNREAWALSAILVSLLVGGVVPKLVLPGTAEPSTRHAAMATTEPIQGGRAAVHSVPLLQEPHPVLASREAPTSSEPMEQP